MAQAKKLDLYKAHAKDYLAPKAPLLITIRPAQYLSVAGRGAPGGEEFVERLGALYTAAYTIKMARKFAGQDYAVCKLEGLWWGKKAAGDFLAEPQSQWNWQLLIRVPDFIAGSDLETAAAGLMKKGKSHLVLEVGLQTIDEGLCVQMLHVGAYAEEKQSIERMRAFATAEGLKYHGKHHEIYLSDPRKVAPEKLRTILRQPVR
ncbi:MAG TPA: GyrI-like domain-containing protein [Isosphaeraceae bacterium]|jgi:hypothetical protein|nr:GyrI-like domain-containing protein [Isosphaeraceae bacterium]